MVNIDTNKCIGCGFCVSDCFPRVLALADGLAFAADPERCFECGHCVAVCPTSAVSLESYPADAVVEYDSESFSISPERLLNFISFRRTVRQFLPKKVERSKLEAIIEAGRVSPTAKNFQKNSYIVVENEIPRLRELTVKRLGIMGREILERETSEAAQIWGRQLLGIHDDFFASPSQDRLTFGASAMIFTVTSETLALDAATAAASMELMGNALGLGMLYSGYSAMASREDSEIQALLGIPKGKSAQRCLIVGYPAVRYLRTVPRRPAKISWI